MSLKSRFRTVVSAFAQKILGRSHMTTNSSEKKLEADKFFIQNSNHMNNVSPAFGPSSLEGKVAVITGSSRSIGATIAEEFAKKGAHVVVNYVRDFKSADEVVRRIQSLGRGNVISVRADVCTASGSKTLIDETIRAFGRLDILVLNAGIMGSKTLTEVDEPFFNAHFNMNVKGPLFLVKAAMDVLTAPGGRIIFFSTSLTTSSSVLPNALCYVASKAAIEQISRVLAKDLGTHGITVNTVSPGPVDTVQFREGKPQYVIDSIAAQSPENRLASPEDIAPVVTFLASPEAQWINGQVIRVNGGYAV